MKFDKGVLPGMKRMKRAIVAAAAPAIKQQLLHLQHRGLPPGWPLSCLMEENSLPRQTCTASASSCGKCSRDSTRTKAALCSRYIMLDCSDLQLFGNLWAALDKVNKGTVHCNLLTRKEYMSINHQNSLECYNYQIMERVRQGRRPDMDHVPQALALIINRCWNQNPAKRPAFRVRNHSAPPKTLLLLEMSEEQRSYFIQ